MSADIRARFLQRFLQAQQLSDDFGRYRLCLDTSSAKINDRTIRSLFQPYVLAKDEFEWIGLKAEMLWGILEKTARLLVNNHEVSEFFDLSPEFLELLQVNPGYDINIPITRFDAFYDGDQGLKFCEFNTDGTSGMNETNTIEECFLNTTTGQELQLVFGLEKCELRKSLLQALLACYEQYAGECDPKPNIAIVDFLDKGKLAEFEALARVFSKAGYNTRICDPREVSFKSGSLWQGDFRIDLAYRRLVTSELLARLEHVKQFLTAYRHNCFCMVGSFRSEAAHSKLVFTFLTSPQAQEYFSPGELAFIKQHLPKTFALSSKNASFLEELLKRQQDYIIKPHNAYEGFGLYLGKNHSAGEWERLVHDNLDSNYIAQEAIPIPKQAFMLEPGKVKELSFNTSPYLYNGKMTGFYTRASETEVISTARGAALVPTLISTTG